MWGEELPLQGLSRWPRTHSRLWVVIPVMMMKAEHCKVNAIAMKCWKILLPPIIISKYIRSVMEKWVLLVFVLVDGFQT